MNDEPFSHKPGVNVPQSKRRNVRHLVAGGPEGEGIVEADDFQGYENLKRLGFRDGTLKIGEGAFYGARYLSRVDFPSSLITIGNEAFFMCSELSEMNLPHGLQNIGYEAFCAHSFRQITIPSTVREVDNLSFSRGEFLRKVTLVGGIVLVGGDAFYHCPRLQRIATPSVVIVVEDGEDGNGRAEVVTGGTITNRRMEPHRLILTSPYLVSMHSVDDDTRVADAARVADITRVKDAINRIAAGRPPGEGPLDFGAGEDEDWNRVRRNANRMRSRFLGLLSAHRRALASILKRAPLWISEGGGLEPGVVEIILSFLGDVEG